MRAMAMEYSGEWDYPEEFSDDAKLDHIELMKDTLAVLLAIHDQIEKADSVMYSPEDISLRSYKDLQSQLDIISLELRRQIIAAQPWLGSMAIANFDRRLPLDVSKECEKIIPDYATYRSLLGKREAE